VLFRLLELAQKEMASLTHLLSSEHGETIADSKGDHWNEYGNLKAAEFIVDNDIFTTAGHLLSWAGLVRLYLMRAPASDDRRASGREHPG
jgi:hypothetical protein